MPHNDIVNDTFVLVGGLVAMGFDSTGRYLLVVSHSGRGVFEVSDWRRVARDAAVVYPHEGRIEGIGPLAGISVPVFQRDQIVETIRIRSPDGRLDLLGESDGITVREVHAHE